ncbi:MAG: hypothetical protein RBS80_17860 [Thermoguttaceae bacterium]|jgi:hypothetical protein|nr:hypothetical protein [Thermoguttaceae bacterium]
MNRFLDERRSPFPWVGTVLLVTLAIAGCGGDQLSTAPVQGKVLYQGKPLQFGAVTFQPAAGPPASGAIQSDGTFRLSTYGRNDGAILGTHKVAVSCFDSQRPDAPPPDPNAEPGLGKPLIPQKYLSADTSGLTAEVKSRNEPFEFQLTD